MKELTKDFLNQAVINYFKGMSCKDALEKARADMGAYEEMGRDDTEGEGRYNHKGYREKKED